jgi:hypothetical protein
MDFLFITIIIALSFTLFTGIQLLRIYRIRKEWGYGEIVVRWVSPEELKTMYVIGLALGALLVAVILRSEALLSALTALLIGFGGMMSQLTFLNIIGKRGIYLGRAKRGFEWSAVRHLVFLQYEKSYGLELSVSTDNQSDDKNIFKKIQEELESVQDFGMTEPSDEKHPDTSKRPETKKPAIRIDTGFGARRKKLPSKQKETDPSQVITYKIRFREKHQFIMQQALMYYYPRAMEYRKESM